MKKTIMLCTLLAIISIISPSLKVYADITTPTITHVYFTNNNTPVNSPVDFTVNCYGTFFKFGEPPKKTYTPANVFSFSATCSTYPCKIFENYYLNYKMIDYCDLEGKAGNETFSIPKFTKTPIPSCKYIPPQYDVYTNDKFYKETPQYKECSQKRSKEADEKCKYLSSNSETKKQGADCYKKELPKINACNTYLQEIPKSQIPHNDSGSPLMRECKLQFDIGTKKYIP